MPKKAGKLPERFALFLTAASMVLDFIKGSACH